MINYSIYNVFEALEAKLGNVLLLNKNARSF